MNEKRAEVRIRVTPRASRRSIHREGDLVRVAVPEPPAEGQANDAVLTLLAKTLKVSRSSVRLLTGSKAREKRVLVLGLTAEEVLERLPER